MAIVIELKRSSVPGKVPTTTELALGELAINTYDGKLYLKKNVSGAETVVNITSGGGSGSGTVTSVGTAGSVNGITLTGGPITSAGTITLGGTLSNILNNQLANSSLTIGSTNISLGGTVSTLTGLSSVTATNFIGNIIGSITSASYAGTSSRVDTSFINTNTDYYVTFVEGTSDGNKNLYSDTSISYNPSTNLLSTSKIFAVQITGSLFGTASFASTASFLSGFVTSASYAGTSSRSILTKVPGAGQYPIIFAGSSGEGTGSQELYVTGSDFSYEPQTRTLNIKNLNGTASFATTASFALNTGAGSNINTGSFATTGSNTFRGNQIITGSLTVTQPITASIFGTASFATTASIAGTADLSTQSTILSNSTDQIRYLIHVVTGAGSRGLAVTTNKFVVNPGTGSMGINKNTIASGYSLDIAGSALISGSLVVTGSTVISSSFTVFTGSGVEFQVTNTGTKIGNATTDNHLLTGSLLVTGSVAITGSVQGNVSTLTISTNTASIDLSRGNFFTLTLSGSTHFTATNVKPGQTVNILLTTNATNNSASFNSTIFRQPSGSAYTPTGLVGANDILTFISYDTTNLYVASVKNLV